VVNPAASATHLQSSIPNPSVLGQDVTFFATVTSSAGLATGTISFYDGALLLGSAPVFDGLAIFTTNLLSVGAHPITAHYDGNATVSPSTSAIVNQVVNQISITATTVTSFTSDLNPSTVGQTVNFDIEVTPLVGSGTPTGVVSLYSGASPLVTLPLVNGRATYSTATLPAGELTLVALYSGDANFSASTTALSQTVLPITTSLALTSSDNPSLVFEPVTFTAQVLAASVTFEGSVSFYDGAQLLGTTFIDPTGRATLTTTDLSIGAHTISATFNGSNNLGISTNSIQQIVNVAPTVSVVLVSSPNPSDVNEVVTFIATVSATNGVPSGNLSLYDGNTLLLTEPLVNGLAVFNTSKLSVGSHRITVVYAGSVNYAPSTSLPYIQVVNAPALNTKIVLTSSKGPAQFGSPVTFTAKISSTHKKSKRMVDKPTKTTGKPTGTVTFFDGSFSIGTSLVVDGKAHLTISNLAIGKHKITAIYSGNPLFNSSTSAHLTQVITASKIPPAPTNFFGCQTMHCTNKLNYIVNVLTWNPPQNNAGIVGYKVYRDRHLKTLVKATNNQCPFKVEDVLQKCDYGRPLTYYIVAIDCTGTHSEIVSTVVHPKYWVIYNNGEIEVGELRGL